MKQKLLVLLFTILMLFSCSAKDEDSETGAVVATSTPVLGTPDFTKLTPQCFQGNSAAAQLSASSLFSGSTWNDPSVLFRDNQYIMYASSTVNFDMNIKIYRMVSTDGKNWSLSPSTAVFEKNADPSAWDQKSVETPSVVYFNNQYHMFYTGYETVYTDSQNFKIGHATSTDGITWTRKASYIAAPVGGTAVADDFDQFIIAEPGAVVFNDKLHVYFTAQGYHTSVSDQAMSIGLITSSDGTNWSSPQMALFPDQTQYPIASSYKGYSTPSAIVMDSKVHLFFDVVSVDPAWHQVRLHHASSTDGLTNWQLDSTYLFSKTDFTWTTEEIRAPYPLYKDGTLHLWFAGHTGTDLTIAYSFCSLLL